MRFHGVFGVVAGFALVFGFATIVHAQPTNEEKARVRAISEQIEVLLSDLESQASEYPEVMVELRQGLINIETADETVQKLIDQLTEITDNMEEGSEFEGAIASYVEFTASLIAEAEGSNSDAQKALIPDLKETLEGLKENDRTRRQTVVDARNVIRQLEKNREDIAFFIKAGEVQQAAELIDAQVGEFARIVEQGKSLANDLAFDESTL